MKDFNEFLRKLKPEHPRMFFNADTWKDLLRRAETTCKKDRDELIEKCRTYTDDPVCTGTEPAVCGFVDTPNGRIYVDPVHTPLPPVKEFGFAAAECALAWRFTGEKVFLEKAKKMLVANAEGYRAAYNNRRAISWNSSEQVMTFCAYDWIYEGLTEEERKNIIVPLVQIVEDIQERPGRPEIIRLNSGDHTDGCYGVAALLWYSGLAACGDGHCDELALANLKEGFELFQRLLEFRNEAAGEDGGMPSGTPDYALGAYPFAQYNFFHTVLSSTGENVARDYPGLALFPNWIYWIWMNNEYDLTKPVYSGFGDGWHVDNALPVNLLYQHLTHQIYFYKDTDPKATRLAVTLRDFLAKEDKVLTPETEFGVWKIYKFLLDETDGGIRPYTAEELENNGIKSRRFVGHGQFHMRSGFAPDSTYAMFVAGAKVRAHKHMDENSFVIKKHDFLAIDTGTRAYQHDFNLRYYYHCTVAHNAMLIVKPDEPFADSWGPEYTGAEGKTNYGGQYGWNESAKVLAYETNGDYTYIASDAAACYGEKAKECVRQFLFVYPDCFVIYDRVVVEDGNYKKVWLLHTVNEPKISHGLMRADCGKGRLFVQTLLPERAVVEKVGGEGKEFWSNGKNWEVEKLFVDEAKAKAKAQGHDVYLGAWREEVSPAVPSESDRFLHVLTATDTGNGVAPKTELIKDEKTDGVIISLPTGKKITVKFNRDGEVGGEITIDGKTESLTQKIQAQTGVGSEV